MSTPTQFAQTSGLLCSDLGMIYFGETPLPAVQTTLVGDMILVDANVLRSYEQMILQLERQVYRYKALFEQIVSRPKPEDEFTPVSAPLNSASVALVDSIIHARIREDEVLRAFSDEEL